METDQEADLLAIAKAKRDQLLQGPIDPEVANQINALSRVIKGLMPPPPPPTPEQLQAMKERDARLEREAKERAIAYRENHELMVAEERARKDRVKAILAEHGIRMAVNGCGCCGSPSVRFEYRGEMITEGDYGYGEDDFKFTMFDYETDFDDSGHT